MNTENELPYTITTTSSTEPTVLQLLLEAYIELNKLNTEPGDKSHMLANSTKFLERLIKEALK